MRELCAIVAEVKVALAAKDQEIKNAGSSLISFVKDAFKHCEREVVSFERSTNMVAIYPCQQYIIITNCRKDAQELLNAINKIKVF
jgi:hypothetical protein